MSNEDIRIRYRTGPPAERPRGVWLAPVKGVFYSPSERWANPFEEDLFDITLEPGISWRSTTDQDRQRITDWFDFFRDAFSKLQSERFIWANTVLRSLEPDFIDQMAGIHERMVAFTLALSLKTSAPLASQLLRFEMEESAEGRLLPHSGNPEAETMHLPGWSLQQELGRSQLEEMPPVCAAVWRVFEQPIDHGMRRCLGAYRAAIASKGFVDAVPILACSALEALSATHRSGKVIDRVARYTSSGDAAARLERLYRVRQWFAHGADIPEMRDSQVRMNVIQDGLRLVKEIILSALQDKNLFDAGIAGPRAVGAYLVA
jgi:hypothetical protein